MKRDVEKKGSFLGLIPLLIFIALYVMITIVTGSASSLPLNVGILIACIFAFIFALKKSKKELSFDDLVTMFCKGGGDDTLILMFIIFLEAGMFYLVADKMGAVKSVTNLGLSMLPQSMILPGVFIIGCVLSFSMGTSMGTVTALMPIGVALAKSTGIELPLMCGTVVGSAMFGDNLSFISDTTIAATRTQGVQMKDKFKANFLMVLPAIVVTLILLTFKSSSANIPTENLDWDLIRLLPYVIVIGLSLVGVHVMLAMGAAILSGLVIGVAQGSFTIVESFSVLGEGIMAMEDMAVIAVMVGGLVALMEYLGGIDWLLHRLTRNVKGRSGAELAIAFLVFLVDVATTNNTIAIITVGPIAKDISEEFGVESARTASILDLFASIGNGITPWAGQILLAAGIAKISTLSIVPYSWYSFLLAIFGIIFIIIGFPKNVVKKGE